MAHHLQPHPRTRSQSVHRSISPPPAHDPYTSYDVLYNFATPHERHHEWVHFFWPRERRASRTPWPPEYGCPYGSDVTVDLYIENWGITNYALRTALHETEPSVMEQLVIGGPRTCKPNRAQAWVHQRLRKAKAAFSDVPEDLR